MMRFPKTLSLAGALAALILFTGEARALFTVQVTATLNAPSPGATTVGGSTVTLQTFTDQAADVDLSSGNNAVHSTYGTTAVTSTTPSGSSDAFNIGYNWTLTFTHVGTGSTATITGITGTIAGNLSSNGSTLNNTYTAGPATATTPIVLDGRTIFVKLDPYTPPGTPPDSKNDFSVSLLNQPVPEPTTLALMGVGGLMLIAPYLRRKARINV